MTAQTNGMPEELTMEALSAKIDSILKIAEDVKEKQDKMEERHAEGEKHDREKRSSMRKARDEAMKDAMSEEDDDKRDAAMKKAMDDYHGSGDHEREAAGTHEREMPKAGDDPTKEHIASLMKDKREALVRQILTASRLINPNGMAAVEERLKAASMRDLEYEWGVVSPATQSPMIPFMASQRTADTTSGFSKLTTRELLEGKI